MSTNYIDQITDTAGTTHDISEGDSTRIFRATCSTATSTAAKVATLDTSNRNFSLAAGVRVAVTFRYGNSATTPTLRVDGSSTGTAKTIAFPTGVSAQVTGAGTTYNTWGPYETVIFTYDGTYWINTGSALGIYNAYQNIGTDEKVKVDELSNSGSYYPIFSSNSGTTTNTRYIDSNNIKFTRSNDTITTTGYAQLTLGNDIASGTAGNKEGVLTLYGSGVGSASIYATPTDSSGHNWKFYLPLGNGSIDNKFNLVAAGSYNADRGSTTRPIYVAQGGLVALCSTYAGGTKVTLNGTDAGASTASFYAPTTAGTSGYYLKSSGSGEPTWASITIPDVSGKIDTAGTGLSKSGTTLNHSNSVTAQTTQAVYPIKIDAQGHISAYGSAVTIPTDTNTTYTLSGALSSHKFTETLTAGGSGSGTSTATMTFAAGTGITLTDNTSTKTITIACDITNTDEKVKQTPLNGTNSIKGLLIGTSTGSTETTNTVYTTDKIRWNDSTRQLYIYNSDGTKYGFLNYYDLRLADSNGDYFGDIKTTTLTANRTWTLPDATGTIALTSDIPDVSGFITSDSDEKVKVAAGSTNTGYYPVLATGAGTATRQYLSTIQLLNSSSYGTEFILGKNDGTSQGLVQLWSKTSGYYVAISPQDTFTANRAIRLPDQDGIIALTKDLDNYLPLTGGTLTGPLTINSRLYVKNYSAIRLYENDGTSTGQLAYMGTDNELYLGDEDHVTHLRGSSIMLKDHTSSIGYITSGSASLDSLTSGSSTQNARVNGTDYQISIPAGGWVITVEARFPSNANGIRGLAFRDSSGTTFSGTLVQVRPVSGGQTAIQTTLCVNYSSDTHVKIGIFQTTGSAMTDISLYYRMIRIA